MTRPVAALYVCTRTPYRHLGVDCYDERRDARLYEGPHPVVAHPPCGPWGKLRQFCTKDDPELAIIAVRQVRQFGGVLEHPAHSRLWEAMGLPLPDSLFPDEFGGFAYAIDQGDFGHRAPKATWLYAVRLGPCPLSAPRGHDPGGRVELMGKRERIHTPLPLARELVEWARSAA